MSWLVKAIVNKLPEDHNLGSHTWKYKGSYALKRSSITRKYVCSLCSAKVLIFRLDPKVYNKNRLILTWHENNYEKYLNHYQFPTYYEDDIIINCNDAVMDMVLK